ncbi:MAG: hypothetical protein Gaeavirus42_5 [Gaeavirus sp.]|uniref:Uncharacterized protein n=1 Tax=Gaeavirus sp. TaxID=2487767 RepID=A0A3G5A3G4_9VIRU|nr:MAG: hypothetical protein Gaeavirus42_5 [Gaeavirus sp.]
MYTSILESDLATTDSTQKYEINTLRLGSLYDNDYYGNMLLFDNNKGLVIMRLNDINLQKYAFSQSIKKLELYNCLFNPTTDFTFLTNLTKVTIGKKYSKQLSTLEFPSKLEKIKVMNNVTNITSNTIFHENLLTLTIHPMYKHQLTNIILPTSLKKLKLGNSDSLKHITIPSNLKELSIYSFEDFITLNDIESQHIKKIIIHSILEYEQPIQIKIPSSVTCIGLYDLTLLKHISYSSSLTKLHLLGDEESINDLPITLEKLVLHEFICIRTDITNLPPSLQQIKINGINITTTDIYHKIKRLPYACTIVDKDNNITSLS